MAAPIFIQLTPDEDAQLQQLLSSPNTYPKVRRRALTVRLSAQPWSAPRIAQFLECHHPTVLNDLKRWQKHRYNGLADGKAPGATPKITSEVKAYLTTLLAEDRIWTARQLQEALATRMQVPVHPATLTRHLKRMGYALCAWGRSKGICGGGILLRVGGCKKGVVAGTCRVLFLDESGFGLWLPLAYSWTAVCPADLTPCISKLSEHQSIITVIVLNS